MKTVQEFRKAVIETAWSKRDMEADPRGKEDSVVWSDQDHMKQFGKPNDPDDPLVHMWGFGSLHLSAIKKRIGEYLSEALKSFEQEDMEKVNHLIRGSGVLEVMLIAYLRAEEEISQGKEAMSSLKKKKTNESTGGETDTVSMDVPFMIRLMEICRENVKSDDDLHKLAGAIVSATRGGKTLTSKDVLKTNESSGSPLKTVRIFSSESSS